MVRVGYREGPDPRLPGTGGGSSSSRGRTNKLKAALGQTRPARGDTWASLELDAPAVTEGLDAPGAAVGVPDSPAPVVLAPSPSPAEKTLPIDRFLSFCHDEQVAEQIRKLRSHLGVRLEKMGGRSLLVTSPGAGEGKSFIALHLALELAREAGRTTVLVDADLQGAFLSARLGLGEREGLSDVLQGRMAPTRAVLGSGLPGLELLPAGRQVREPSALLGTCALRELFATLAARYSDAFLLLDGPALGNGAGALLLSGSVDGVLLVTEAERTSARSVREGVEALSHRNLLGLVLNKARA